VFSAANWAPASAGATVLKWESCGELKGPGSICFAKISLVENTSMAPVASHYVLINKSYELVGAATIILCWRTKYDADRFDSQKP
jgi:hypothetical protein